MYSEDVYVESCHLRIEILIVVLLCSEEEAKKKIYSVCTSTYTGFGALISEELSYKVKGGISIGLIFAKILLDHEVLVNFIFNVAFASLRIAGSSLGVT